MTTDRQMRTALAARFPAHLERTFQGRGGRTFTYVPDESVMDRLDEVFGVGGWSIGVDPIGDRCVRVTLRIVDGDEWVSYQDFGYPANADSAEPLKEASGDGLRRCARYIGIARYLYAGDVRPQPVQNGPRAGEPARVAPVPAPLPTRLSEEDAPWPEELPQTPAGRMTLPSNPDVCSIHDLPWLGEEGSWYHRVPTGGYCRANPRNTPRAAVR